MGTFVHTLAQGFYIVSYTYYGGGQGKNIELFPYKFFFD